VDNSIGIGDLAAILTVAGVTIYVLGLIGLAIPIYREFAQDLTTAWYVVALVPKTVVAGQGVRIWLQWPVVFASLFLISAALESISPTASLVLLFGILLAAAFFVGAKTADLAIMKPAGSDRARFRGSFTVSLLVILMFLLIGFGGTTIFFASLFLTGNTEQVYKSDVSFLLSLFPERSHFFFLLLLGSFLLGILPAITATPPLPRVDIIKKDEGNRDENSDPLKGYLVAHSAGFWHLFAENKDLLAIPDDQVSYVRVVRKADPPPVDEPIHIRILRLLRLETK
jgi:hypothetical protein